MLSTPFICCSSGVATACSIVCASAPLKVPVTMICGGTISGNCATGSARSDTRPPSTVTIAMTMATMGRRTKKAAMSAGSRRGAVWRERPGRDLGSLAGLAGVDDHAIAGRQAFNDDDSRAEARPGLHGLHVHGIVGPDDPHLR